MGAKCGLPGHLKNVQKALKLGSSKCNFDFFVGMSHNVEAFC